MPDSGSENREVLEQTRQRETASHSAGGGFHRRAAALVRGAMTITVLALLVAGTSVVVVPAGEPTSPHTVDQGTAPDEGEASPEQVIQPNDNTVLPVDPDRPDVPIGHEPIRIRVETSQGVFLVFDAATSPFTPRRHTGFAAYWSDATERAWGRPLWPARRWGGHRECNCGGEVVQSAR